LNEKVVAALKDVLLTLLSFYVPQVESIKQVRQKTSTKVNCLFRDHGMGRHFDPPSPQLI